MAKHTAVHALALGVFLTASLSGVGHAQRRVYAQQVSLPEGTVLRAELKDPLSSVDNQPGDRFTAVIRSDEDGSRLPAGTELMGQVRSVRRAGERQPGTLDVELTSLRTPDGRTYPITASLASLDAKSVRRASDGRLESVGSSSSSKNRTKFIGYGAGAGALIGALAGSDLLLSTILGAGAGYLYSELSKDKQRTGSFSDVSLKAGTEFGVKLDQVLAMTVPAAGSSRYDDRYPRTSGTSDRYPDRYDRAGTTANGSPSNDIRVLVNERTVRFNEERPFMANGRVMVPLAPVMDATGYRHDYDTRNREITVRGDRGNTRLIVGDTYAWVDGTRVRLDAPAQRIDGVLFVPTQFLEESTDIRADWDAASRTLRLTSRYRASQPYDDAGTRVVR